jgi:putative hemolysin
MKAAIRWVSGGGALGVFPAGEVSQFRMNRRSVADPAWSDTVARLALQTGAAVLPVFFDGRNSLMFQTLGLIHPRLRTLMLPRELLRKRHQSIRVRIGNVIPPERISRFEDAGELTDYLRVRTYVLRGRPPETAAPKPPRASQTRSLDRIASPVPSGELSSEVQALPPEQCLARSGGLRVLYAAVKQIPGVLREIGRLREMTFRAAGEGTGKSLDLDDFDPDYLHLFVWSDERGEVVGGYRMGLTDQIVSRRGIGGLYTSTLFHYHPQLLEQLGPAIELGRSFVRQEYQKEYGPLSLLWKGIGHYVARQPRYRMLFGPVSISNDYQSLSRQLLVMFLRLNRYLPALGELIAPRNEPKFRPIGDWDPRLTGAVVRDVDRINELLAEIETDRSSMPVLLRQYLKLNARLLGVNVDPDFADVVDALMLVDLTQVQRPVLNRYLGHEGAATFLAFHGSSNMK